jgi:hypothetical protein
VQSQLQQESQERSTDHLADTLLDEVLEAETAALAAELHFRDVTEKDRRLEDTFVVVRRLRLQRYFNQWRNNHMGESSILNQGPDRRSLYSSILVFRNSILLSIVSYSLYLILLKLFSS